jgi:hypothetical protein
MGPLRRGLKWKSQASEGLGLVRVLLKHRAAGPKVASLFACLHSYVGAQPGNQLIEVELVGGVEAGHEGVGLLSARRQAIPVDGEECISRCEGNPLCCPSTKGWFWERLSHRAAASSRRSV